MNRLILVGSVNPRGRSAHLAAEIFDACIDECPQDVVKIMSVGTLDVAPCTGCGGCSGCKERDSIACTISDDMEDVYASVAAADELILVAPVYFAGPSAQFKALLDRFQPFFYTDARHGELRPATLHIVGEGHDPFGFDPLVTICESALLCVGFELETLFDWTGRISADGEITAEAEQYTLVEDQSVEEKPVSKAQQDLDSSAKKSSNNKPKLKLS